MAPSLSKVSVSGLGDGHNQSLLSLEGSNFIANGHVFLSDVPQNIIVTPSPYGSSTDKKIPSSVGSFVGFEAVKSNSRHVVPIGKLNNIKFMSIFRFKVWWTTHWVGSNGKDLENETQMVILEKSASGRPYILLLPLLEGPFRASLQPGTNDNIDICVESGSTKVTSARFQSVLYIHVGEDPFNLVKEAMEVMRVHLGTFKLLDEKTPPGILDKFGWCTWDAFYLTVHPQGVWEGVKGLADGGCPPGMVLIDDGWQSISRDEDPITKEGMNCTVAGEQMPCRLLKFQENYKFRNYESPKTLATGEPNKGMGAFIKDLKDEFNTVEFVYVWHALCGYWGGLMPNVPGLPESEVIKPELSPGLKNTMEDLAVDKIVNTGIGFVPPEKADQLYEGIHSHLKNVGIDGVKLDVIHLLEMLCENYGGRVDLAKAYYRALTDSIRKHFNGNGVIASMEHCNDFMFLGTEAICLGRVGDDFWGTDPSGDPNGTFWLQGCHMFNGVIGAFNCQGGGWCPETRRNHCASQFSHMVTAKTNPKDIEWNNGKNPFCIEHVQVFALYLSQSKKLVLKKPDENIEISLQPFDFELVIVSPVTVLAGKSVHFAPIGLVNMLNAGGAILTLTYDELKRSAKMEVKGSGEMRVFASEEPKACNINGNDVGFLYEEQMAIEMVQPIDEQVQAKPHRDQAFRIHELTIAHNCALQQNIQLTTMTYTIYCEIYTNNNHDQPPSTSAQGLGQAGPLQPAKDE
ncbi:hypothetical protein GOBAR_DD32434 [Gossypium barbadense]|nr:hypothetical protein GOBAR_DD32434 [Gossypium barbadense]